MRRILTVIAFSIALLATAGPPSAQNAPASNNAGSSPGVSQQTGQDGENERLTREDFIQLAATSLLFDIEAAELAVRMAQDRRVQDYAGRLLADRRAALQDLRRVSEFAHLPDDLDADNRRVIEALGKEQGADFDASFVGMMADANDDAIDLYEEFLETVDDDALSSFVQARLETFRAMSEEAHTLDRALQPASSGNR